MNGDNFLISIAVIAALLIAIGIGGCVAAQSAQSRPCAEDAPCWTWSTMGNRQRGITLKGGKHVVVKPLRFAQLWDAGRIDWRKSAHLRGDYIAYSLLND